MVHNLEYVGIELKPQIKLHHQHYLQVLIMATQNCFICFDTLGPNDQNGANLNCYRQRIHIACLSRSLDERPVCPHCRADPFRVTVDAEQITTDVAELLPWIKSYRENIDLVIAQLDEIKTDIENKPDDIGMLTAARMYMAGVLIRLCNIRGRVYEGNVDDKNGISTAPGQEQEE